MFKRGGTTGGLIGARVTVDNCSSSSFIRSLSLTDSSSRAECCWLVRVASVDKPTDPSIWELDWLLGNVEPLVVDFPSKGRDCSCLYVAF